tara:strand:+ start:1975 stop:2913 length:939 start_codon:yes stop_codon:yes gene_type:complete
MKFKKPKFWDFEKTNLISYILLPFTIPIILNNFLLNKKVKRKNEKLISICVGNIYIGGTGKTPTTIKIYQILKKLGFTVAIGKKYYSAQNDEKILLENKSELISLTKRDEIIKSAIQNNLDYLVFDDGLQDRNISYDCEIVCFNQKNWIGNGNLIPAGPLREKISSLKKYDAVILKGLNLDNNNISQSIKKINPQIKIFKSFYKVKNLKNFDLSKKYLFFCGIGSPENFRETLLKNNFQIIDQIIFPDHYDFKKKDIMEIKRKANEINAKIVTTEKDFIKISQIDREEIDFLEVDLQIENEENFINFIRSKK